MNGEDVSGPVYE